MATNTPKLMYRGSVPTSITTEYTVPGSTTAFMKSMDICNTTSATISIRIHLVPSGGSADTSNALWYDTNIPPKGDMIPPSWEGEQIIAAAGTIQMYASAAGLAIHISGVEQT